MVWYRVLALVIVNLPTERRRNSSLGLSILVLLGLVAACSSTDEPSARSPAEERDDTSLTCSPSAHRYREFVGGQFEAASEDLAAVRSYVVRAVADPELYRREGWRGEIGFPLILLSTHMLEIERRDPPFEILDEGRQNQALARQLVDGGNDLSEGLDNLDVNLVSRAARTLNSAAEGLRDALLGALLLCRDPSLGVHARSTEERANRLGGLRLHVLGRVAIAVQGDGRAGVSGHRQWPVGSVAGGRAGGGRVGCVGVAQDEHDEHPHRVERGEQGVGGGGQLRPFVGVDRGQAKGVQPLDVVEHPVDRHLAPGDPREELRADLRRIVVNGLGPVFE